MISINEKNNENKKPYITLFITFAVMGAALIAIGISGYIQAQKNAETSAFAEVSAMMHGLKRDLSRNPDMLSDSISGFISDSEGGDLKAVALLTPLGEITYAIGNNKKPFNALFLDQLRVSNRTSLPIFRLYDGGVVHAVFSIPKRFGRKGNRNAPENELFIAVEAVSQNARSIISRAFIALAIELMTAVALLGWALWVLRQKSIADARRHAIEEESQREAIRLERDERLKALGRMSAILGHELQNPIAALKGHAQLLLEKVDKDHPEHATILTIVKEAGLLESLTKQVLDFVRTGEVSITKTYIDDLLESAAALSNLDSVDIFAPENETWMIDRARAEQALVNLLNNANQASPKGSRIDLRAETDDNMLRISVRDRGEGIEKQDIEHIFQPFYTGRAQGTGLGLALVKRIVVAHGGTVEVYNHPNGGAVFTMYFPKQLFVDAEEVKDAC